MFEVAEGGFLDIDVKITGPDGKEIYKGTNRPSGCFLELKLIEILIDFGFPLTQFCHLDLSHQENENPTGSILLRRISTACISTAFPIKCRR